VVNVTDPNGRNLGFLDRYICMYACIMYTNLPSHPLTSFPGSFPNRILYAFTALPTRATCPSFPNLLTNGTKKITVF
jgi:hypothetical protein